VATVGAGAGAGVGVDAGEDDVAAVGVAVGVAAAVDELASPLAPVAEVEAVESVVGGGVVVAGMVATSVGGVGTVALLSPGFALGSEPSDITVPFKPLLFLSVVVRSASVLPPLIR